MKKLFFVFFECLFELSALLAFNADELDFSIAPKTTFTKQEASDKVFAGGALEIQGSKVQNKTEVPLPSKVLMRGFERFKKVDAFGNAYPDTYLFYRSNLTNDQKSAYDEVYKALMNAESEVNFISRLKVDDLFTVIWSVYYDNPELFWWAGGYQGWYNISTGYVTSVKFNYLFSKTDLPMKNKQFFNMTLPIIFYANLLDSDIEKIKYIHDYLCLSIDYDYEAFNSGNYGGKLQTAYSAVVEYKTVCAGYSRAFAYYMQQLGLPCTVLYGSGHAWNMLELNGDAYQIDVTWDDGESSPKYFNLPHVEMQKVKSHQLSELSLPVVAAHPTKSSRYLYANCFGNIPLGKPYTYAEFSNIAIDIENPAFASVSCGADFPSSAGSSYGSSTKFSGKNQKISLSASMLNADGREASLFHPRDKVQFKITSDRDAYLAILMIDAKGVKTWLPMNSSFIEGRKARIFPDIPGAVLRISDDGVYGTEQVIIYASSRKDALPSQTESGKYTSTTLQAIMKKQQASRKYSDLSQGTAKISYTIGR